MSRSTQYIGLTKKAERMTEQWDRVDNSENWMGGMFGEEVSLGEWRRPDGKCVREVVQADPWSGGPMIFTCLYVFLIRAKGIKREGGMYFDYDYSESADQKWGEVIEESKWEDVWPAPKDEFDYSPEYDREKGEFYFGLTTEEYED
jgi:hypothetical protein